MKTILAIVILTVLTCFGEDSRRFPATVDRVVDGDTMDLTVDLGFEISKIVRIRLMGLDAPETWTRDGKEVKRRLAGLLEGKAVVLVPVDKEEKFGRILAVVYLGDMDVNTMLVKQGLAKRYDGGKRVKQKKTAPATLKVDKDWQKGITGEGTPYENPK
jgi:micrococcal nuclease